MEKITQKDIEWLLSTGKTFSLNRSTNPAKSGLKRIILRLSIAITGLLGLIILPFFLLIRTSVYLNLTHGFIGWASLGGGIVATVMLLMFYVLLLFRNVPNKKLLVKYSLFGISSTVLGFCLFSLFYLSAVNAKSPEVRELYRSMHPVLRVAITTVTLADNALVITDIGRESTDYAKMGLPVNPVSMHYKQSTGYVHAVDLRTHDRGYIRNSVLKKSLEAMGFKTLRHTGTADHLHVELPG
jgi:hypothetical protein